MPSWVWVILIFTGVFGLGVIGLPGDLSWQAYWKKADVFDSLYGVLQLFVLEGRIVESRIENEKVVTASFSLRLAAVLAPIVTILAFLQLIWRDLVDLFDAAMYRWFRRGHIVVCGVGYIGRIHIKSCIEAGKHVVAIDTEGGCRSFIPPRTTRCRFIEGDASVPTILRKAGASRASAIVIFCGSDLNNLRLAEAINKAIQTDAAPRPRIICCNTSPELTQQAFLDQRYTKDLDQTIRFFDPFEAAARHFVRAYPPDVYAGLAGRSGIHLAIYGFQKLGQRVLLEAIGQCQIAETPPPRFTVFDNDAAIRSREFAAGYPDVSLVASVDFVAADVSKDSFFSDVLPEVAPTVSQHVVCLEDPAALEPFGLRLQAALAARPNLNAPMILGMMTGFEPTSLAEQAAHQYGSHMLRPFKTRMLAAFGDNETVLSWDNVIGEKHDRLARRNHENYLAHLRGAGIAPNRFLKPAAVEWDDLAEQYRRSNRSFVDHIPAKLRSVGRALVKGGGSAEFDEDALHKMAISEHMRWCGERLSAGWRFGETRSDPALIHPNLVPWDSLDDGTKAYDMTLVGSMGEVLDGSGETIKRTCHIGVTGHRSPGIGRSNRALCAQIKEKFDLISRRYPDHDFVVVTALAEGADRLVADLAVEHLSARLMVTLPLPLELYLEDFVHGDDAAGQDASAASMEQFQTLLAKADFAAEMPQKFGGFDDLASRADASNGPTPRQHQYAYGGAYLVQHCHELICIWDGQPSRGTGGTAEVVGWREAGAVPEIYRWTGLQVGPVIEMTEPLIIDFQRE